ncbi:hypothetical protein ACFP3U_06705 [Kitasatospora misakiensis]|uniref:Uncharacterized protein n=1 Tax=Kitasatospora misakiensis TaxID=67330 RepID=A0ABW0WYP7_9ACTN
MNKMIGTGLALSSLVLGIWSGPSAKPYSADISAPTSPPPASGSTSIQDERLSVSESCAWYNTTSQIAQEIFVMQYDDESFTLAYHLGEFCRSNPDTGLGPAVDEVLGNADGTAPPASPRPADSTPLTDESKCSDLNATVESEFDEKLHAYLGSKAQNGYPALHHTPVLLNYCGDDPRATLGDASRTVERNPNQYGGR